MIRFISGFLLGYMAAKRPPTREDVERFGSDLQRLMSELANFGKD